MINQHEENTEQLWDDFLSKSKKAQDSLNIKDGIEAGQAWGAFLNAFVEDIPKGGSDDFI